MPGTVLVTVGTTKFDELIRAVDDAQFLNAVKRKGYSRLVVQHGAGARVPQLITQNPSGLEIECFDFKPQLATAIASADLVISHAGSGSIFEGLSTSRAMIVIPNESLMHNHQVELAQQLASMQHLVCSTPAGLAKAVADFDASALKPYKPGSAARVAQHITSSLGLQGDPQPTAVR